MSRFLAQEEDQEEEQDVQQEQPSNNNSKQNNDSKDSKAKDKKKKDKKKEGKKNNQDIDLPVIQENVTPIPPSKEEAPQAQSKPEPQQPINEQPEKKSRFQANEDEEDVDQHNANNEAEDDKGDKDKDKKKKKKEKKQGKEENKEVKEVKEVKENKSKKPMNKAAQMAQQQLQAKREIEEQIRKQEEEIRLKEEEEERIRQEEERKRKEEEDRKREEKKKKKDQLKEKGEWMTKKEREEQERVARIRDMLGIDTNKKEIENTSNVVKKKKKQPKMEDQLQKEEPKPIEEEQVKEAEKKEEVQIPQEHIQQSQDEWEQFATDNTHIQQQTSVPQIVQVQQQQSSSSNSKADPKLSYKQSTTELRSPICCILGHVDTGKTTLLDKIRNTNVQEGEAGGITQQIGATFFPEVKLSLEILKCASFFPVDVRVPGLLIIDTPGHESFSNLRNRGSSLCDLAILVIDLMHGLENQTLESLELLKMRKTPFVIALNKIDRCFEWKKVNMGSSYLQYKKQSKVTREDFDDRSGKIFTELAKQGFNVSFFWENPDPNSYVSVIPTSGITGEGIPDILTVIVKYTSLFLKKKMQVKETFNCTVLERKCIEGYGSTIDCILVDGKLKRDDKIVLQGFNGPFVTKIKAILTPHPMKEMRVKGEYINHDILYASMGLKIAANDLEDSVAGSQLYVCNKEEEVEEAKKLLMQDYENVKQQIELANTGVGVAASTLGSLEALLQFLKKSNIPVAYVTVGPVSKEDIMKALKSVLSEEPSRRKKEYACMLVFDVKVIPEAQKYAEENGVKVFEANIIYHLFDQFMAYLKALEEERRKEALKSVVFPCLIKPIQFFNKKDPIILGCDVLRGVLKPGTPICIQSSDKFKIGIIETIEHNKKQIKEARATTGSVAVRIKGDTSVMAGRHFQVNDPLVSIITRQAIDTLKEHFREEMTNDDWLLVRELKAFFNIQ